MDVKKLYESLLKYRQNLNSKEDFDLINEWYDDFNQDEDLVEDIPGEKLNCLFINIESRIKCDSRRVIIRRVFQFSSVAASVAIILSILFFLGKNDVDEYTEFKTKEFPKLILSDGSEVELDNLLIIEESGFRIMVDSIQRIDYEHINDSLFDEERFNTLIVPKMAHYELVLSDGTRVKLNSGSSIRYPVIFGDKSREVILTGEAFFEVSRSDIPFIVNTGNLDIRVLGTSFNISAYEDDKLVTTVLVSGSVSVMNSESNEERILRPNQLLSYSTVTNEMFLSDCDSDIFISWTYGVFKFRNMRLEDIMKKVDRWYNTSTIFEDDSLKELTFSGAVDKYKGIEYFMENLKIVRDLNYDIKEDKVVIKL